MRFREDLKRLKEILYIFFVHVSFWERLSTHSSSVVIKKRISHKTLTTHTLEATKAVNKKTTFLAG